MISVFATLDTLAEAREIRNLLTAGGNAAGIETVFWPTAEQILTDPTASLWLKKALRGALECDVVDAANEAEVLALVLNERAEKQLKKGGK